MLSEPLPTTLDVRKAAAREVVVKGFLEPAKLPRLSELLASEQGRIEVSCSFYRDEEYRSILAIEIGAELQVVCQRCLEAMDVKIASSNELAVIRDDDKARQLPSRLDPLVLEEDECALWSVAEDELILSLPIVSYHETDACKQLLDDYAEPDQADDPTEENPFKVLEQLKSSQENQEF
jgi:uncharacterized protein